MYGRLILKGSSSQYQVSFGDWNNSTTGLVEVILPTGLLWVVGITCEEILQLDLSPRVVTVACQSSRVKFPVAQIKESIVVKESQR